MLFALTSRGQVGIRHTGQDSFAKVSKSPLSLHLMGTVHPRSVISRESRHFREAWGKTLNLMLFNWC